jgi:hypothetical protein
MRVVSINGEGTSRRNLAGSSFFLLKYKDNCIKFMKTILRVIRKEKMSTKLYNIIIFMLDILCFFW